LGRLQAEAVGGAGVGSGVGVGAGTGVGMMVGVGEGVGPTDTGEELGAGLSGAPGPDGSSSTIFLIQPPETTATTRPTGNERDHIFMGDPQA
jgi:hypothetical protein